MIRDDRTGGLHPDFQSGLVDRATRTSPGRKIFRSSAEPITRTIPVPLADSLAGYQCGAMVL
jgi:hypothetical protein